MTPTQIEQLIAKGDIAQALRMLLQFSKKRGRKWYQATLIQSGHYEALKRDKLNGTISQEEASIRSARIKQALLDILDHASNPSIASNSGERSKLSAHWQYIGLLSILLFGLFIGYQAVWKTQAVPNPDPVMAADSTSENIPASSQPENNSEKKRDSAEELKKPEVTTAEGKNSPKKSESGLSFLKVTVTDPDFLSLCKQEASSMLQEEKIPFTLQSARSNGLAIEFMFDVDQERVQSGFRDDAIRYSVSLLVNVTGAAGQICQAGPYAAGEGLIAYADENKGTVAQRVLRPQLATIKKQLDLAQLQPCLREL